MQDLTDTTFTIPVRFDHEHRKENLDLILKYISNHFDTNFIVLEDGPDSNFKEICEKYPKVLYVFQKNDVPLFHRTKLLNQMCKMCATDIIVNYDADVLFTPKQYTDSVRAIRENLAEMVFPYAGKFMECNRAKFIPRTREELDVSWIKISDLHQVHPNSVGGAVFWDRKKFIQIGMENESFLSWGWEDDERLYRAKELGLKVARIEGVLYHIEHFRSNNSNQTNPNYKNNEAEFRKMSRMKNGELKRYIASWNWIK